MTTEQIIKEIVIEPLERGEFYKICSNETTFKSHINALLISVFEVELSRLQEKIKPLNCHPRHHLPNQTGRQLELQDQITHYNQIISNLKNITN